MGERMGGAGKGHTSRVVLRARANKRTGILIVFLLLRGPPQIRNKLSQLTPL